MNKKILRTMALLVCTLMVGTIFGVPVFATEQEELINVALNKPVTAGAYYNASGSGRREAINDGNYDTYVYRAGKLTDNANGIPSTGADDWYIIDLNALYPVEKIRLHINLGPGRTNYRVYGSKTSDFAQADTILSVDAVDDGFSFIEKHCDGAAYRYIKLQRTVDAGYGYSELEVYAREADNVALNKPVKAGAYYNASGSGRREAINDGNYDTYVYRYGKLTDNEDGIPSDSANNWYTIDLQDVYHVEKIKLHIKTGKGRTNYRVYGSKTEDFANADTILSVDNIDDGIMLKETYCGGEAYRFIKLQRTADADWGYSELEVYAYPRTGTLKNVALGADITSGAYHASYPKTMLNDGKLTTPNFVIGGSLTDNENGVASAGAENWWIIDLGKTYPVEAVKLYSDTEKNNSETYFKISGSKDGEAYDTLYATVGAVRTALPLELNVYAEEYRYIKLEKTGGNGRYYYNELEVYTLDTTPVTEDYGVSNLRFGTANDTTNEIVKSLASFDVTNNTDKGCNVILVSAFFDEEGEFVNCAVTTQTVGVGETKHYSKKVNSTAGKSVKYLKTFIWENGTLRPLGDSVDLELIY